MKKNNLLLSVLVFLTFTYFYVSNLIVQLDLFYVMWGYILIPLPVAFILLDETEKNKIFSFALPFGLLLTLFLFLISYYSMHGDTFDTIPDPGPSFLDLSLTFSFIATILLSYIVVIINFTRFNRKHIVSYLIMIPIFAFCYFSFGKYRTLEYISGILLFILIGLNYGSVLYSRFKSKL